jgi:hypothetical protein
MPGSYLNIEYRLQELSLPNTRSRRCWESNTFVIFANFTAVHIVIVVVCVVTKQSRRWPPQDWRNITVSIFSWYTEYGDGMFLKGVNIHLSDHMVKMQMTTEWKLLWFDLWYNRRYLSPKHQQWLVRSIQPVI